MLYIHRVIHKRSKTAASLGTALFKEHRIVAVPKKSRRNEDIIFFIFSFNHGSTRIVDLGFERNYFAKLYIFIRVPATL